MRDEEWRMKNEAWRLGVAWDWRIFEWWEVRNKTETIKTFLVFLLNLVSGIESTGIDCTVYMVTVLEILQTGLYTVNCTVARTINSVWNCKRMKRICFFFSFYIKYNLSFAEHLKEFRKKVYTLDFWFFLKYI